jgi:hypothetical protein
MYPTPGDGSSMLASFSTYFCHKSAAQGEKIKKINVCILMPFLN